MKLKFSLMHDECGFEIIDPVVSIVPCSIKIYLHPTRLICSIYSLLNLKLL